MRRLAAILSVWAVFCVFGDSQPASDTSGTPESFRTLVTRLAGESYGVNLTLGDHIRPATGDSSATVNAKYDAYLAARNPLFHRFLATPGNHEFIYRGGYFLSLYEEHLGESAPYVVLLGGRKSRGVALINLPTEGQGHEGTIGYYGEDDSRNSSEAKWLVGTLRACYGRFIFVFMHHPMYDPKTTDNWYGSAEPARLDALFSKYGVRVVFAGHQHNYRRHVSLSGVTYLTFGMGGAPPVSETQSPLDSLDATHWGSPYLCGYTIVSTGKQLIYCTSYRYDGKWSVGDRFSP